MWISVRTRRFNISPRLRQAVEGKIRRIFTRDHSRIASIVAYVSPLRPGRTDLGYTARVVLWSTLVGQIAVNDTAPTVRSAVGRAARRARKLLREQANRKVTSGRLTRHFNAVDAVSEAAVAPPR
jgi:ribosome-associated translation inhibitor RaiA